MNADQKFERLDVIKKHLRALSLELDGYDRSWSHVGQAMFRRGKESVRGTQWDCLEFEVRDDRGQRWAFTLAISPAGRAARLIHGRESRGRIAEDG